MLKLFLLSVDLIVICSVRIKAVLTRDNDYIDCQSNISSNLNLYNRLEQPIININNDLDEGCCSVIIQITSNHHIVAFRRDAVFPAEIIIKQKNFYGKNAEIQYKVSDGLFYHTVITSDAWIVGTGGCGSNYNKKLISLAGQIMENGTITQDYMKKVQSTITKMGVGHFLIKSPDNNVGFVITHQRMILNKLFKMQDGEFICVPNAPQYYRKGNYIEFNSNPIIAAAKIEGTDPWGFNRRNVIIHDVQKNINNTMLQIWALFDDGSMINKTSKGGPDNIQFLNKQIIYGKNLPVIPEMTKIGEINLLNNNEVINKKSIVKRVLSALTRFMR